MDNVPADVVKAMGAGRVVAVNVGDLADLKTVNYSLLGLAGETLDAMMRANTKAGIKQADIIINVPLADYGSLDWRPQRRAHRRGLQGRRGDARQPAAARGQRSRVRAAGRHGRDARRRTALPRPAFVRVEGFSVSDRTAPQRPARRPRRRGVRPRRPSRPTWRRSPAWIATRPSPGASSATPAGENGLLVEARVKPYGPPFLMLGLNLENTTSQDFRLTLTARYLALRPRRIRLRAAHRRHHRVGSRTSARSCTSRSARARCSSRPTRASPSARSTSFRTMPSWRATDRR